MSVFVTCVDGSNNQEERIMKKLFAAIAAVSMLAFAVPAMAQQTAEARIQALEDAFQSSMKFYGSARMTTFYYKDDSEATGNYSATNLDHNLQGNARIGGRVQAGDVRGHFEYGGTANLRHLYGEWDFGPGKLLVGQTETPTTFFTATRTGHGDNMLFGYGSRYIGRRPMVQLTMGDFKVALVRNQGDEGDVVNSFADTDEIKLPQLQASYTIRAGAVSANIAGAWQTFDIYDSTAFPAAQVDQSIDSYMLALGANYNIGPATLFGDVWFGDNVGHLNASDMYGNNPGSAGATSDSTGNISADDLHYAYWNGTSVVDSESFAWLLGARYRLNDMISFEAAYSERTNKLEDAGVKLEAKTKVYYLQAPITLAKGVWIVPEIGKVDWGNLDETGQANQDLGSTKYFGAKWQINF